MFWEVPVLSVITELRSRAILKNMGRFDLQILYARAMTKLWEKIEKLKAYDDIRIADFGTRRRHSFLWQDWCIQAMIEGLDKRFIGTSNCLIAMRRDLEAIGTNAHELPMIYSALSKDEKDLKKAQYDVLDTEKIIYLHKRFSNEIKVGFGWGTLLTNDFRGLSNNSTLDPFSIVCKATSANGKPTVKLSDNKYKTMGPLKEIQKYREIFELKKQNENHLLV